MFTNELGTGVLNPETERKLIAEGVTFAQRVFRENGSFYLRTCKGDMNKIAAKFILDACLYNQQLKMASSNSSESSDAQ